MTVGSLFSMLLTLSAAATTIADDRCGITLNATDAANSSRIGWIAFIDVEGAKRLCTYLGAGDQATRVIQSCMDRYTKCLGDAAVLAREEFKAIEAEVARDERPNAAANVRLRLFKLEGQLRTEYVESVYAALGPGRAIPLEWIGNRLVQDAMRHFESEARSASLGPTLGFDFYGVVHDALGPGSELESLGTPVLEFSESAEGSDPTVAAIQSLLRNFDRDCAMLLRQIGTNAIHAHLRLAPNGNTTASKVVANERADAELARILNRIRIECADEIASVASAKLGHQVATRWRDRFMSQMFPRLWKSEWLLPLLQLARYRVATPEAVESISKLTQEYERESERQRRSICNVALENAYPSGQLVSKSTVETLQRELNATRLEFAKRARVMLTSHEEWWDDLVRSAQPADSPGN